MHIEMTTTCRVCGREWQPDHSDFIRNTWRVCPRCRDGPDLQRLRTPTITETTRTGEDSAPDDERITSA